jgi:hypothetical protein
MCNLYWFGGYLANAHIASPRGQANGFAFKYYVSYSLRRSGFCLIAKDRKGRMLPSTDRVEILREWILTSTRRKRKDSVVEI